MTKYKIGQKVKVREDLNTWSIYDGLYFIDEMMQYKGTTLVVESINDSGNYCMEGVANWRFTDAMLADVETEKEPIQVLAVEQIARLELYVDKVILNDPATIMFYRTANHNSATGMFDSWSDTKKVVAKVNKSIGDEYNAEKGINVAILKAFKKEAERQIRKY